MNTLPAQDSMAMLSSPPHGKESATAMLDRSTPATALAAHRKEKE
jgi:hypothetical protein